MSCAMAAPGPAVIHTPPAYVDYRKDAALIVKLYASYAPSVEVRPAPETSILPETSAALVSFTEMGSEIRHLLDLADADDFGPVRPTTDSVEVAKKTLFKLAQAGFEIPLVKDLGTDHEGGLRITWERGPRFLELVVPHEDHAAAYFYYSQGEHYGLQRDLTPGAVCERFSWLAA